MLCAQLKYEKVFRYFVVIKAKYPARKLTDEDKEVIQQVAIKYAAKYYALTEKYPNLKKYAEKVVLKKLESDKDIAAVYTVSYVVNSPPGHIFKPGEINQKLVKDIQNTIPEAYRDITKELEDGKSHQKGFLHPRDLRERVLQKLENDGMFLNIRKKEEIRHLQRKERRPGRKPHSTQIHDDLGGRPSDYVVTKEVERLKAALEKPGAIDFLHKMVVHSGLAHKIAKFNTLVFLHAAKMNERALHKMMGTGTSFARNYNIREQDIANFKAIFKRLQSLDDAQLEQFADDKAKLMIEDKEYYALISPLVGLLKL
jgi:hypothetical protein